MQDRILPKLPHTVTTNEIETFLDRVAEDIIANCKGETLLPMFLWLEEQLQHRKPNAAIMERVKGRLNAKNAPSR